MSAIIQGGTQNLNKYDFCVDTTENNVNIPS